MNRFWHKHIDHPAVFISAVSILGVVYAVGVVGLNSAYQDYFIRLTPLNLLMSFVLVAMYHRATAVSSFLYFFFSAYMLGWAVEVLGIHTGFPFGAYSYTDRQGWRIAGVPLLIGVNWFLMSYSFGVILCRRNFSRSQQVLAGALAMTFIDVLLEFFAVHHQLWIWEGRSYPGWENFAGWFGVSLLLQCLFVHFIPNTRNRIAPLYILCLFVFLAANVIGLFFF